MSDNKKDHERIIIDCDVADLDRVMCEYGMRVEFGHAQLGPNPDFQKVSFMEYLLQGESIPYRKTENPE